MSAMMGFFILQNKSMSASSAIAVSSVQSQEIGWEERLRSDLVCVKWDV